MEGKDKSKEINIKNCTCYYFDDIRKTEDFEFDNILINGKPYKNILVNIISYKSLIGAKLLRIRFNKVEGFIKVYDGTRYLVIIWPWKIWCCLTYD